MKAIGSAIRRGLVCSCHDLSEGGLAVALAEMAIAGSLGVRVDLGNNPPSISDKGGLAFQLPQGGIAEREQLHKNDETSRNAFQVRPQDIHHSAPLARRQNVGNIVRLFSESASRFIVEVTPEHWEAFEAYMRTNGVEDIKHIGNVTNTGYVDINDRDELIYLSVEELQAAWKGGGS
jgi:phosphoribosylformylglycinamidine synthase